MKVWSEEIAIEKDFSPSDVKINMTENSVIIR